MYHNDVKPLSHLEQVTSWRYEDGKRYIEFRFEKLTLLTLLFQCPINICDAYNEENASRVVDEG